MWGPHLTVLWVEAPRSAPHPLLQRSGPAQAVALGPAGGGLRVELALCMVTPPSGPCCPFSRPHPTDPALSRGGDGGPACSAPGRVCDGSVPPAAPTSSPGQVCVRRAAFPGHPEGAGCLGRVPRQGLGGKRPALGEHSPFFASQSPPPGLSWRPLAEAACPGHSCEGCHSLPTRPGAFCSQTHPVAHAQLPPAPLASWGPGGPLVGGRLLGDVTVTGWQPAEP